MVGLVFRTGPADVGAVWRPLVARGIPARLLSLFGGGTDMCEVSIQPGGCIFTVASHSKQEQGQGSQEIRQPGATHQDERNI